METVSIVYIKCKDKVGGLNEQKVKVQRQDKRKVEKELRLPGHFHLKRKTEKPVWNRIICLTCINAEIENCSTETSKKGRPRNVERQEYR